MVYQLVLQEKLAEVSLLLAQNQEQQVGRSAHAPRQASRDGAVLPQAPRVHRRKSCGTWQGPKAPG